jgi:polyhydroxyalkanoate synthesis regulator phasin
MKTQNVFKTLAMVAFSAISLGLVACSELGSNPAEPMAMFNNVQTTFDLNGQPVEFTDASLEIPMEVRERPDTAKKGPRSPFDRLLASLNLTPDQKVQVERLLAAHKDCATAALEALKTAERAILDRAKAAREEIKASVEAGTITRDEARQKVRDLNKATREAIKNLPEREAARAALKACDDAFLARLSSILDEKQKGILDTFVKNRDARNGGGPRGGDKGGDKGGDRGGKDSTGGRGPGGRGTGDSTGTGGRG